MKGLVRKRMVIAILGVAIGSPGILMARSRRILPLDQTLKRVGGSREAWR